MFCKKQIRLWPISGVEPFMCRLNLMLMTQDLCLSSFALGWALEGSTFDLGLRSSEWIFAISSLLAFRLGAVQNFFNVKCSGDFMSI
jgi:hypothetical protein